MQELPQQLVNGVTLGCIYGLLAISYSLIFGALRVVNFAIGEAMMVGAFSAVGLVHLLERWHVGSPLLVAALALLAGLAGATGFSLLTELVAFRPIMYRPKTPLLLGLISSLGVSITAQNLVLHFVDSGNVDFPIAIPTARFSFLGATVTTTQIVVITTSLVLMILVALYVQRTRIGRQIRAVRDNRDLAAECGVNPRRAVYMTFIMAGLLAGVAGLAVAAYYGVVRYNMGFTLGIKAFSAAILGGIGDIPGGVFGGMMIGLVEALSAGYVSAQYKDVFVFLVLIVSLLFRTRGILGRGIAD